MSDANLSRAEFLDQVLTSRFAGETAKRILFDDGEVGAVYTLSRKPPLSPPRPIILVIVTFPPALMQHGVHNFGLDYYERPVASAAEAHELLAQFDRRQAAQLRASCRVA